MCWVDLFDADLADAPLTEAVGRNGDVPGSIVANHVWLLLTLL